MNNRIGNQRPTKSVVLPYDETKGQEAVSLYSESGRSAIEWQSLLLDDIMAVNEDGLWVHQKFGYSVPRRNGKNEVISMRELWGLMSGETMCHTAHRTTTSHSAWVRLVRILTDAGYIELGRARRGEKVPEKSYKTTKQYGLESITLTGGGEIVFRTRTPNGGLGEGFDLLVIDEAQEYTDSQESALVYTVSDSMNPQTLFCGTPPTVVSAGTVFNDLRKECLLGQAYDTGWAEWSIDEMLDDPMDVDAWYETNPSMGFHLNERKVRAEWRGDKLDFNIQRLGVWIKYNQKSAISANEWDILKDKPQLTGKLYAGVKFAKDGKHVAMAIACRTTDGRIFVECLDCRPTKAGNEWMIDLLRKLDVANVTIDGASGQSLLKEDMKEAHLRAPILPTVNQLITANASFERAVFQKTLCHSGQYSLSQVVSNCEKRPIGSAGGFGYKAISESMEIALLDSVMLAHWACSEGKEKQKQKVVY